MKTGDPWTISHLASPNLSPPDTGLPTKSSTTETADQSRALQWAVLVTGHPEIRNQSPEYVQLRMIDWWRHSAEGLSRKRPDFPESFRTTRFSREIRFIEGPLAALKPAFDSLCAGESSFWEAMDHLGRNFGWNKDTLLRWKRGLESPPTTVGPECPTSYGSWAL